MKKSLFLCLALGLLSGCSLIGVHKMDIEQGNIITQAEAKQLKLGMTRDQVINIMGNPVLIDVFTANEMTYVYTYQPGYSKKTQQKLICLFKRGHLASIATSV